MDKHRRIHKILIANRGEIALRVMRTCRDMGIATVAVFSDADGDAPHVAFADEAVHIGPAAAAASYLDIERVLGAAELTGADAVHPGYGFLAENAAFARACAERGLTFIGPGAEVIELLGSKREAKRVVAEAGVPVIPGYDGADQDTATLAARAREIGFPVLIKASAGGGGKGMRVVRQGGDKDDGDGALEAAIESAKREAKSAFGDDTLLIETYIDHPRHVEIQILGDSHGTVVHLFERECSIQRRHQKIIEESPSPALDDELRRQMGAQAVAVGKAVGYVNAGTVEFILGPDRRFYFLEVNTRLQVEHPVTEMVTGLDLVREQIRVARGEAIDTLAPTLTGAAMECRLYAEDPDTGFLPATGRIVDWHLPEQVRAMPGLRVDAGVSAGQEVGVHYDPMLAKIITHAPTRGEAIDKMICALTALSVHGVATNRALLLRVLGHPAFARGDIDTHFLDTHADDLRAPAPADTLVAGAAMAASLAGHEERRARSAVVPGLEPGFRNNRFSDERVVYTAAGERVTVEYHNRGGGRFAMRAVRGDAELYAGAVTLAAARRDGHAYHIAFIDERGWRRRFRVIADTADRARHYVQAAGGAVVLVEEPRFPERAAAAVQGGCVAPMPGTIISVAVTQGQEVTAGDTLLILEAMKMEHAVRAPEDGVVTELFVAQGDRVDSDQLLAVISAPDHA